MMLGVGEECISSFFVEFVEEFFVFCVEMYLSCGNLDMFFCKCQLGCGGGLVVFFVLERIW